MQKTVTEDRYKYIGGSDIPIIMGLSPFKTRYQLLKEKARVEHDAFSGNIYTEYGDAMEPKIREHISKITGKEFIETVAFKGAVRYHADGAAEDTVLEIKTTSQTHEDLEEYKHYLVQLLTGMWANNIPNGILAVYARPDDFSEDFDENRLQIFYITYDQYYTWALEIKNAVELFLTDLDFLKINPFSLEQDLPSSDNLIVLSNEVLRLENELIHMKETEKRIVELKAELKAAMERNNLKTCDFGNVRITLTRDGKDKEVQSFNEDAFCQAHPKLYKQFSETKIKKGRRGYVTITVREEG